MQVAITRKPARSLSECELTFVDRSRLDFEKARTQHLAYESLLESLPVQVISLEAEEGQPDSVFVEDTAIVLDECAIICSTQIKSRQRESATIEPILAEYRAILRIEAPAFVEGGDILTHNKTLFVGISTRTNHLGFSKLKCLLKPFGYNVLPTEIDSALHLKTACAFIDEESILINPNWIDRDLFGGYKILEVDIDEPFAANALSLENTLIMHSGFPKTIAKIREQGFDILTTDISEFQKAEAGLTCMSLLFKG